MQKLFFTLLALFLFTINTFAGEFSESFHLETEDMKNYLLELGIETEVNETELNNSIPYFNVNKIDEDSFKFSFDNKYNQSFTLEIFSTKGEKVDAHHFIADDNITVKKGYLANGDYIYNLYDQFGNIYSGLITY